jgi:hypothetical protein
MRARLVVSAMVAAFLAQADGASAFQPPPPTSSTQSTPPRDDSATPRTGTASIAGVVTSDEREPRPLRRARVMLNAVESPGVSLTAITGDDGRFTFTKLPPGRFTLNVSKEPFVGMAYGAKQPRRPGTSLALRDGQQLTGLTIRLPPGAVLTGTITDPSGQPAPGVTVSALRYGFVNGERRLGPAGIPNIVTDDRGMYRIFGLPAGEYAVAATPPRSFASATAAPLLTTEADVSAALEELSGRSSRATPGGAPAPAQPADAEVRRRGVALAPVLFPGTTNPSEAAFVSLAAGQVRAGVDMQLQRTPTAKVEGVLTAPEGVAIQSVQLSMVSTGQVVPGFFLEGLRRARPDATGGFTFDGLPPGTYVLTARANAPTDPRPTAPGPSVSSLWAMTEIAIDGHDLAGVAVDLQPGMTVSGRVQFDASELPPPANLAAFRVTLPPITTGTQVNLGTPPAQVAATGEFTIAGVAPGQYRLQSTVPSTVPGGSRWALKSAVIDGRDVLDEPLQIRPGQHVTGAVVTFTDRPTEITGVLQDASGAPASEYFIIVFAADRRYWTAPSRRIQSVRPSHDGRYSVRNLPAGEYLLVAMTDVEQGEWMDPAFLDRVSSAAMRLTLADRETRVQDLTLGAR